MAHNDSGPDDSWHDSLKNLEKSLYSRTEKQRAAQEVSFTHHAQPLDLKDDWNDSETFDRESLLETEHISSFSKWMLRFSVFFFIVAAGVGSYIYFKGVNVISSNNIAITVAGPVSVGGGQELDLEVTVKNQNTVDLSDAVLTANYPDGARNPDNISLAQTHTSDDLGAIPSGGSVTKEIRVVLFGQQSSTQDITFTLNYQAANSNASYEKEKDIQIAISSVPVTLTVSSLKQVNSNQDIEFDVTVTSNSASPIDNLLLQAAYGFGFTFESASPQPIDQANDAWSIGTLNPGQQEEVKVTGKLQGQDGQDQAFTFTTGIQSAQDSTTIDPVFLSTTQTVTISKPFIGINLTLDGSSASTYIANVGQQIHGNIVWVNNSPTKVNDAQIVLSLTGATLDKTSVVADDGFYDSSANTITWDQTTDPDLLLLNPGDTGTLNFSFASLVPQISDLSMFTDAQIPLSVNVSGTRVEDTGVPSQIVSSATQTVDLDTSIDIVPQIVYNDGPFTNAGPLPPRAGKSTTYTVILSATNTTNAAQNVQVTATMPEYVKWLGIISPTSASQELTYASTTGTVQWDIGDLPAGAGFSTAPSQVAFQVSFTPSVSQVNTVPTLLNNISMTGIDAFTSDLLSANHEELNTMISSDSQFVPADSQVTN